MTRRSQRDWPPAWPGRRGFGRSYDPFYQFERLASDDGKPYKPPEPKLELQLLALLGSNAALVMISFFLAVMVATVLVLLVTRL